MSDPAIASFHRINSTPLRDLFRGRITARLDWKHRLKAAGFSAPVAGLIVRVVRQTRLWRLEKAAVADELIAHFLDGLASGASGADLLDRFGDERVAARLIRRAKKRNRPLPWHAWIFTIRTFAILLGIYGVFLIRFCVERPVPTIDYVAKLNESAVKTAISDRAWPIYHQAVVASSDGLKNGELTFSKALNWDWDKDQLPWDQRVAWLNQHASAVELIRQASEKPVMGFVLDGEGTIDNPKKISMNPMHILYQVDWYDEPSYKTYDRDLSIVYRILTLDIRRAAEAGDGDAAEADLMALAGLAKQFRTDPVSEGPVYVDWTMAGKLQWILVKHREVLKEDQLIRLARALSGPKVAADLLNSDRSSFFFQDFMQQVFTDDGNGDGHMTLAGLRTFSGFRSDQIRNQTKIENIYALAAPVPFLTVSRSELQRIYDRARERDEANWHLPFRLVDEPKSYSLVEAINASAFGQLRYGLWLDEFRSSSNSRQAICEEYLGDRDGALTGIALELYRRHHGNYPASLSQLTPDLLCEVPIDRITGDPIKYRIVDGKPIVYSVGADQRDDGGTPPPEQNLPYHCEAAAWHVNPADVDRHDPRRGDWLIYPAIPWAEK